MKKQFTNILIIFLVLFVIIGCKEKNINETEGRVINWDKVNPEELGVNSNLLNNMDDFILKEYPKINSVIVLKQGTLLFENYYNEYNSDSLFKMASVTKTFTSALIGIAIQEGYIGGINDKVVKYFPQYAEEINDSRFKELTIEDLLTMTDSLAWADSKNKKVLINPIKYAFGLSLTGEPGDKFNYSTLNSQILSGIITEATGMNELDFADKYLFGPLGIKKRKWSKDLQGNNTGGFDLQLRTRDMAKFGQLYLNGGLWNEQQILPRSWINLTTKKYSEGGLPHGEKYGYHVWVTKVEGFPAYFAGGLGGQFIYVVPELDLVVAITSELDMHREKHRKIINNFIVPAITNE